QNDGCPTLYARKVREPLDELYPNRWIGRGGSVSWPAPSPDLTPLDFFLQGVLRNIVYQEIPTTPENMRHGLLQHVLK
ncbi:hypothetical protein WH47_08082, partial [Habropoda laboriosa]